MSASRKACWFLVLSGLTLPIRAQEAVVGSVKTAHGSAAVRRGADTTPLREGMHLFLNDVLQTAADGLVGVILQDGTRISLGPNTELKIDRYIYQPEQGKFGLLLRLGKGVLGYISGRIAHFSPESVTVETPVGVLGLRGTHFAISIDGI